MAIKRIWHGWTTPDNADRYRKLLHDEVFPGIEAKKVPGYLGIELFRRDLGDEVEFVTIMTFESLGNTSSCSNLRYRSALSGVVHPCQMRLIAMAFLLLPADSAVAAQRPPRAAGRNDGFGFASLAASSRSHHPLGGGARRSSDTARSPA